jgi:hypothetical protein
MVLNNLIHGASIKTGTKDDVGFWGSVFGKIEVGEEKSYDNYESFISLNEQAKKIAIDIETIDCLRNDTDIKTAFKTLNELGQGTPSQSFKCTTLDGGNLRVLGLEELSIDELDAGSDNKAVAKEESMNYSIDNLIKNIFVKYVQVEESLRVSIGNLYQTSNKLHKMRQKGSFGAGESLFLIDDSNDTKIVNINELRNTLKIQTTLDGLTYLGIGKIGEHFENSKETLIGSYDNSARDILIKKFDQYTLGSKFSGTQGVGSLMEEASSEEGEGNAMGFFKSMIGLVSGKLDPSQAIVRIFGNTTNEYNDDSSITVDTVFDECIIKQTKCVFPKKNVLLSLQDYGGELLSNGVLILGVSYSASAVASWGEQKTSKDGTFTSGNSKFANKANVLNLAANFVLWVSSVIIPIAMMMILIGVFLAFILPTVFFMAHLMLLLNHILYCVMIFIVSPLTVFLHAMRFDNRQGEANEYSKLTFTIIGQLVLKPVVIFLSLIIVWHVLNFMLFFVLLILPGVLGTTSDDFFMQAINALITTFILGMVCYMVIRSIKLSDFVINIFANLNISSNVTAGLQGNQAKQLESLILGGIGYNSLSNIKRNSNNPNSFKDIKEGRGAKKKDIESEKLKAKADAEAAAKKDK